MLYNNNMLDNDFKYNNICTISGADLKVHKD